MGETAQNGILFGYYSVGGFFDYYGERYPIGGYLITDRPNYFIGQLIDAICRSYIEGRLENGVLLIDKKYHFDMRIRDRYFYTLLPVYFEDHESSWSGRWSPEPMDLNNENVKRDLLNESTVCLLLRRISETINQFKLPEPPREDY